MNSQAPPVLFRAVVLAGERPGALHPVAEAAGVPFAVLAPIGDRSMLQWVIDALAASRRVDGGVIVAAAALATADERVTAAASAAGLQWRNAEAGPSASAAAGVAALDHYPVLITTGDHPLLDAAAIDAFCAAVVASHDDFLIGYARHADVRTRLPDTRRTRLAFADGGICGCNLFAVRTPAGLAALRLWQRIEAERKRPWRVIRLLGPLALARYLLRQLRFGAALARLSELAGCRIGAVPVSRPELAVDVDTPADWRLVRKLLSATPNER